MRRLIFPHATPAASLPILFFLPPLLLMFDMLLIRHVAAYSFSPMLQMLLPMPAAYVHDVAMLLMLIAFTDAAACHAADTTPPRRCLR